MLRSLKSMWCEEIRRLWSVRFRASSPISCTSLRGWMKMEKNITARAITMLVHKCQIDHPKHSFPSFKFLLLWFLIAKLSFSVINQVYDAEITPKEYVMRGNSAIIKCLIPSFVADFVQVTAWINEDDEEILGGGDFNGGTREASRIFVHFLLIPKD